MKYTCEAIQAPQCLAASKGRRFLRCCSTDSGFFLGPWNDALRRIEMHLALDHMKGRLEHLSNSAHLVAPRLKATHGRSKHLYKV
jgi:hypothetical protein